MQLPVTVPQAPRKVTLAMLEPLSPPPAGTVSPAGGAPVAARRAAGLERARRWVYLLEDCFRLPGTRLRFGLEAVVGLVPALGDLLGLVGGLPLLVEGMRRRLPLRVLLAMAVNLLLDAVLGSVPLAGDAFDLLWKANRQNLRLLEQPAALGTVLREAGWKLAVLVGAVAGVCAILALGLAALFIVL